MSYLGLSGTTSCRSDAYMNLQRQLNKLLSQEKKTLLVVDGVIGSKTISAVNSMLGKSYSRCSQVAANHKALADEATSKAASWVSKIFDVTSWFGGGSSTPAPKTSESTSVQWSGASATYKAPSTSPSYADRAKTGATAFWDTLTGKIWQKPGEEATPSAPTAPVAKTGFPIVPVVIGGAVVVGAVLLLKKKK